MDDGVRGGRPGAQALEVLQAAVVHGDPGRSERGRGIAGAREPRDRMAGGPKLLADGRADPSGGPGNKNTHDADPFPM